jgi:hypothetical protein
MHQALWNHDGKSFYVWQPEVGLQEIDAKGLIIKNKERLVVGPMVAQIMGQPSWGADGMLMLGFAGNPEVGNKMDLYTVDPKTLAVTKILPAPNASLVQSAKNLSVAFLGGRNIWTGGKAGAFRMINLSTGAISQPTVNFPIDPESFKVSPDGKYLFATDGKAIARFRIEGTSLVHEQTSKKILSARRSFLHLEMSPSGEHVWLTSHDLAAPFLPEDEEIVVLDAKDLSRTVRAVPAPAFALAVDPRDGSIVTTETQKALRILDANQMDVRSFVFEVGPIRRIHMNPAGGSLILQAGTSVHFVQLPPAGAKVP